MSTPSFRQASRDDVPGIVELLRADAISAARERPAGDDLAVYFQAFEAIDRDPNQLLAVAEAAGKVVGTLQLTFIPGLSRSGAWRGLVEAVHVSPAHRGGGVGAAFLQWAIDRCGERGCRLVQLTTDKRRVAAHRFYERLGFEGSHLGFKKMLD